MNTNSWQMSKLMKSSTKCFLVKRRLFDMVLEAVIN